MRPAPESARVRGDASGAGVAVTSDQSLVADAVRTALERHGLDVLTVPWRDPAAARGGSAPGVPAGLHVVLMLCDLDTPLLVHLLYFAVAMALYAATFTYAAGPNRLAVARRTPTRWLPPVSMAARTEYFDVDTADDLRLAADLGLGPRTAATVTPVPG